MTDAVQPLPVTSRQARKPRGNPKADLRRYFMLAHGSHLVDTARFLCGEIIEVRARLAERFGAYCWFVDTELRQRRARPSRPDRGRAHGLARGLPALRRARQHPREDLQPLVLPLQRRRDLPREGRDLAPRRSAPTGISSGGSWKALPTAVLDGAPMRGAGIEDGARLGPRHGGDRANRRAAGRPVRVADMQGAV